ncbi:MAG: glutamate--tRNA ligase [Candidatus Babeliales bacterium]
MENAVRVRFAPSPTGLLHLGSVRIALFNYLFAKQKKGTFILRIEDTDPERNFDPGAKIILEDLAWLNLTFDEGPNIGGPYAPYFQSERAPIYQEKLDQLKKQNAIYRCFCTQEELEKKRKRQIALKQPPRYDRTCLALSIQEIKKNLLEKKPFIWRFKLITNKTIEINDLARGVITFDFSNFSDFPLTRQNGTFTFIFANAIDDMVMKMSHIFRGEDHISNTPCQAALFEAFNIPLPIFWHMPIICNVEGKKLSKRDFGFSLRDLKHAGFLPEAICNYLAIIGGSFEKEIMNMSELIKTIDFSDIHSTSAIRYDVEKLKWVNHQWLIRYMPQELLTQILPFLEKKYPQAKEVTQEKLISLIKTIQPELKTLQDAPAFLSFYFEEPEVSKKNLLEQETDIIVQELIELFIAHIDKIDSPDLYYQAIAKVCKEKQISLKHTWRLFRIILTGKPSGPGVKELLELLGPAKIKKRIQHIV